jgi:hypothetical protein
MKQDLGMRNLINGYGLNSLSTGLVSRIKGFVILHSSFKNDSCVTLW